MRGCSAPGSYWEHVRRRGEQLQRRWLDELRRRPTSPWRESPSRGCAFSIRRDPGAARATSGGRSRRTWQAETNETATHEDRRGGSPPKRKILMSKFSPTNLRRSSQRNCGLYCRRSSGSPGEVGAALALATSMTSGACWLPSADLWNASNSFLYGDGSVNTGRCLSEASMISSLRSFCRRSALTGRPPWVCSCRTCLLATVS